MIRKIINIIINILNKQNELFYVGSLDNLPEPLTKEEEIMYVKKVEEGDTKAREILIEHNLRLVVFLAKRRGEISFEDSLSYDSEGNELHLEDILGTEKDIVTKGIEEEHDKKVLYQEINKLKKRDKQIMILRYGLFNTKEMTQKDVADLMGISQSYISRIEKKVIKKIKTATKI